MTDDDVTYKLVCPQCGSDRLGIQPDDVDADDGFIGDPEVVCVVCWAVLHMSDLVPSASSIGHTLHMIGGDATWGA